ncbi:ABC transporter substrate-binding protein [Tepidibacter aestuarii]|uniref:ABC transporter substrate-binding protein n=1 Tax=Tepidibacter aestuarii TaxID=2925782 RepID=UPI0020C0B09A|nr:peptide ABC transporter substrate-binding protein [Tepidibacter aestuarii]CAH2214295.1 Peptide/nickel transport system substrate-binding protein [Tepidibacter aestuarii]
MKKIKIIFLLVMAVFLFGCSKSDTKINEDLKKAILQEEDLTPKEGGSINISVVEFKTLNPLLNNEKSLDQALKLVYDSLFIVDENYNIKPKLVKDYTVSQDGMSLNISLKDNIRWHDGVSLTSQDVQFTINLLKTLDKSTYKPLVKNVSRVDVLSDTSFNIVFNSAYSFSLENFIFPILPKHRLSGLSIDGMNLYSNNLIGSGMYKIDKYEKRKYIDLVKNEEYYDKKPYIDKVRLVIVPDKEAQESMLISLETDICKIDKIISGQFPVKRFDIREYTGNEYEFIALNFDNQYIQDINFRKALLHSIDREKILKDVYLDNGDIVEFPLNKKSKYYNKELEVIKFDIDKAKKHLSNINLEGVQFKAVVNKQNFERLKEAYLIKNYLADVGIDIKIVELSEEELTNAINNKDYDLALLGWTLPIVPDPMFNFYNSFTNYNDDNVNILIQKLISSNSESEKIQNYNELEKYVSNNIPFISLLIKDKNLVLNNKIKGKLDSSEFNIYNGFEKIYISE